MAIIKKYRVTVEHIENPLPGIYTLTFSSEKKFKYKPGQFLHLALDEYNPAEQWPESRCFSMQSSPDDEMIKITYAVKGKFTGRMAEELFPGKEIWIKLPYGELFQTPHEKNNCVFIAGGTGVTPFLSLFNSNQFLQYNKPILYIGFRSKVFNSFVEEINNAIIKHPDFIVKEFYENINGKLDIEKIYSEEMDNTFFLSGPPKMINSFRKKLLDKGVNINKIVSDDWE